MMYYCFFLSSVTYNPLYCVTGCSSSSWLCSRVLHKVSFSLFYTCWLISYWIFPNFILCPVSFRHAQTPRRRCLYPSRWVQVHPQEQKSSANKEPEQSEAQRGDACGGGQEDDGQPRPREHYHICSHRAQYGKGNLIVSTVLDIIGRKTKIENLYILLEVSCKPVH